MSVGGNTGVAPATVVLNATAADTDGTITSVEFLRDGALLHTALAAPYSYTWNGVQTGSYGITARATDNAGARTLSTPVNVTVANAPPTVSISSPPSGSQFTAPASINFAVSANDANGSVTQVQYFANGSFIGSSSSAPFGLPWANVSAGSYTVFARGTDNEGAQRDSAAISLTVNPALGASITPTAIDVRQCNNPFAQTAAVSVSGGTAPFSYSWQQLSSNGSGGSAVSVSGGQTATFSSYVYGTDEPVYFASGVFRVTVTDAAGKQVARDISVTFTIDFSLCPGGGEGP